MADYDRVRAIFFEVCDLEEPELSQALTRCCNGDEVLEREVRSLISFDADPSLPSLDVAASLCEPSSDPLPTEINGYRIIGRLGGGGMADVFEAEQSTPQRRVALKMLRSGYVSGQLIRRFRNERQVLASLDHPLIAQIFDGGIYRPHGNAPGVPYFVMELVAGTSLTRHCASEGLADADCALLVADICDAIQHAHDLGVVHRDLKPSNILVDGTGRPRILDFGIARVTNLDTQYTTMHTSTGQVVGTIPYMSPEQIAGRSDLLDHRTDIYSLGVVLYEALTGRLPLDVSTCTLPEAARIIQEQEATVAGRIDTRFRGPMEVILRTALEKDPERRYQTARDMADDLRRYAANDPITARPPSTALQLRRFARRNKPLVAGVLTAFLALIVGLIGTIAFGVRESGLRHRAESSDRSARQASYYASIAAGTFAIARGDEHMARTLLASAPEAYRRWEWDHLMATTDATICSITLEGETRGEDLAWTPDDRAVALIRKENHLSVIEIADGTTLATFEAPADSQGFMLSPRASAVGWLEPTDQADRWILRVSDRESGETIAMHAVDASKPPSKGAIRAQLSPLDDMVLIAGAPTWNIVRLRDGSSFPVRRGKDLVITRDAVYSGAEKGTFEQTRLTDGVPLKFGPVAASRRIASDRGGQRVVISSQAVPTLLVYDGLTLEKLHTSDDGGFPILAVSDDLRFAAARLNDGIRLRDLERHEWSRTYGVEDMLSMMAFNHASDQLLVKTRSGFEVIHLDLPALKTLDVEGYVYSAGWSPDGHLLATANASGRVQIWDVDRLELLASIATNRTARGVCFSPDHHLVQVGGKRPRTWDPWTGEVVMVDVESRSVDWLLHEGTADTRNPRSHFGERGVVSRDGTLIAQLSQGGVVVTLRTSGEVISTFEVPSNDSPGGAAIAMHPDNTLIAVANQHGVTLWTPDGTAVGSLPCEEVERFSMAFSPDGTRLLMANRNRICEVWDLETREQVLTFEGFDLYVHSVIFSPDGSRLALTSGDGTVQIRDARPATGRWARRLEWSDARARMEARLSSLTKTRDFESASAILRDDQSLTPTERSAALATILAMKRSLETD